MSLVALGWLWHTSIRPLPKLALLGSGALLLLVLAPMVAVVRNTSGDQRLSAETWITGFLTIKNPAIAIISEMGNTLEVSAYTLQLVPAVRAYDVGRSYFYAAFSLLPNIGWDIHPSVAHGLLGDWLVTTVQPMTAALGGGLGYSFIAEAFINFGWIASPLTLAVIGFALGKLFRWRETSPDPARTAAIATFLSFFLVYARGESASIIRGLFWYAFVPYLCVKLIQMRQFTPVNRDRNRHEFETAVSEKL